MKASAGNDKKRKELIELVRARIEGLRPKLLDLTRRNPLIATKFSGRGTSHIRVVDELPDVLFFRLSGQLPMKFVSLPALDEDPKDEKDRKFRDALANARLTDEIYIEDSDALDLTSDSGLEKSRTLDREIKDRVRKLLGMPPRVGKDDISLVRHAKNHKISPEYDLPNPGEDYDDGRHTDDDIQTLLLPDDLERALNGMTAKSRAWIQETGLNVLHAAFGFLEWTEANGKESSLAPLVLIPIEIIKKKTSSGPEFWVKGLGEDGEFNSVLAEKLRLDFNVVLPLFGGGSIEEYLKLVREVSPPGLNWRVKRQVAFGVFPSARMAMYHDLDTSIGSLAEHEILIKLFGGGASGGASPFADEYAVDEPEIESKVPCLVMDADSSQFSAIVDIANGQNLALEGPPGTGKSQTIVNTIAAALAAGKKVLFVAEKMAALNVVKARLEAIGLGEFVLPLQADRSTREQVMESIRVRLDMSVNRVSKKYEEDLKRFRSARSELAAYVETLSTLFEGTGLTVYEVLGKGIASNVLLDGQPVQLRQHEIGKIGHFDKLKIEDLKSLAKGIETAAHRASNSAELWRNQSLTEIDRFIVEEVCEQAASVGDAYQAEVEARSALGMYGFSEDVSGDRLHSIVGSLLALGSSLNLDLIARLLDIDTFSRVKSFFEACECHESLERELINFFANPNDPDWAEKLIAIRSICQAYSLETPRVALLRRRIEAETQWLDGAATCREQAEGLIKLLPEADGWKLGFFGKAYSLVSATKREVLLARRHSLTEPAAVAVIRRLVAQGRELRKRQDDLDEVIYRADEIDVSTLRGHLGSVRDAGFFCFFSSKFRSAKQLYLSITRRNSFDKRLAVDDFAKLLDFKDAEVQFLRDPQITHIFGFDFAGTATNFDLFDDLADFYSAVDTDFAGAGCRDLRHQLKTADADILNAFFPVSDAMSDLPLTALREKEKAYAQNVENLEIAEGRLQYLLEGTVGVDQLNLLSLTSLAEQQERFQKSAYNLTNDLYIRGVFADLFEGPKTRRDVVEGELYATDLLLRLPSCTRALFETLKSGKLNDVGEIVDTILKTSSKAEDLFLRLCAQIGVDGIEMKSERTSSELAKLAHEAASDSEGLYETTQFSRYRQNIVSEGFAWLIPSIQDDEKCLEGLPEILEALIYRAMTREVYKRYGSILSRSTGERLDTCRAQIAELDRAIISHSRQHLRALVRQNATPPSGINFGRKSTWTDMALIENEIGKRQRFIPVRDLTKRASEALLELKPCWMMSPLAVAQYLPKDKVFDLTIIDEASQMTPEDAVGALARSTQAMVVGDTNQLPPSNFFRKMVDDDEMDEDESVLNESILEMANATFKPPRRLRWHYRSRHSGLIKFSNHLVYDDKLIVFPSANEFRSDMGVSLVRVRGKYKAGTNGDEARAMVDAILKFMRTQPTRSLGVVTLNQKQRDLLQEELGFALQADQAAQKYVDFWQEQNEGLEEFFVKNLENVQGDERDVIFIGTVYGPEEYDGPVMQRFGPINGVAGKRRLNVLFSRAKLQIVTFSSMTAADIRAEEGTNVGANMLKRWLEYSATGILHSGETTNREPDSDFEIFVINQLKAIGCEVVPQVGIAGYFIDIGVKHPDWPHGYILGVECDGANYHSSKSARDRDRLRQEVLEGLGWKFHRIWSTDWFGDYRKETERLRKRVVERLSELKAGAADFVPDPNIVRGYTTEKNEDQSAKNNLSKGVDNNRHISFEVPEADSKADLSLKQSPDQTVSGIGAGDTVRVRYLSGDQRIVQVTLSATINAPREGIIHVDQPLAQALIGADVGDEVELLVGSYVRKAIIENVEKV